jgi:NAD(P)-dependent dehydrogenase (short-subunit alcohol dehydrogenase family)
MALLEGRVAIVTGAGSIREGLGNGKAVAVRFAREGASVFAIDRNEAAVAETAEMIRAEGGKVVVGVGDVSRKAECARLVAECREALGVATILHNNVGIGVPGEVTDIAEETWKHAFAVNVDSMLFMCQAAVPGMIEAGGGAIINVSTIASIRAFPGVAYGTTKGAVNSFTLTLAGRLARHNIRVNAILPGYIDTPLVGPVWQNESIREHDLKQVPLRRFGSAWEIASVAAFLASDEASYVTGVLIPVDGGLTIRL